MAAPRSVNSCVILTIILSLTPAATCFVLSDGSDPSYCPQLGCDEAGAFTQDGFKVPMTGERTVAWTNKLPMLKRMNAENDNYGCVGSSKVVVCPFRKDALHNTSHIMLHPDTGAVFDQTGYETLENINMPILTRDNLVFAVNGSHASLVDPIQKRSYLTTLPRTYSHGMLGPVYLPELDFFVVFGNFSETHSVYKIGKDLATGKPILNMVTTFSVAKEGKSCPWLPIMQPAALGNRLYFYAFQKDEISGIIAADFMADAPYYKKVWEVSDESSLTAHISKGHRSQEADNCTLIPQTDPDYSIFPPTDVSTQMLATPDGYLVITTPIGLMTMKDHGDTGEQVAITLFGAHFLTLDMTPTKKGEAPIVWMTGWPQYPPFRSSMIAYNYSDTTSAAGDSIWAVEMSQYLGADDFNVTSRFTAFPDPDHDDKKILVFGVSVNTTKVDTPFHNKYCTDCKLGINKMLMAVRTAPTNTMDPDILWMTKTASPLWEVRGQVIGVSDKLVAYVSDGKNGNIMAFK